MRIFGRRGHHSAWKVRPLFWRRSALWFSRLHRELRAGSAISLPAADPLAPPSMAWCDRRQPVPRARVIAPISSTLLIAVEPAVRGQPAPRRRISVPPATFRFGGRIPWAARVRETNSGAFHGNSSNISLITDGVSTTGGCMVLTPDAQSYSQRVTTSI